MAKLSTYSYVASDQSGKQVKGSLKAKSRDEVAMQLREKGLLIVAINEDIAANLSKFADFQVGGIALKDKMILTKQLSTMLSAGLPVLQSIDILSKQLDNKLLQEELTLVREAVEGGAPLSVAFKKNTKIFNEVQMNLLAAGEKSGNMVEVIANIAEDLEKSQALKSKIRSAMIYPIIVVLAIVAVLVILVVFMVPTVESLYRDFNAEDQIPGITQFLINVANILTNPIVIVSVISVIIIAWVSFKSFKSTESGTRALAQLSLKAPVFGALIEKMQLAQFGRLLSMLMISGVSIIDSLEIVAKSMSNPIYTEVIRASGQEVSKGVPLAVPLAKSGVFPLIYVRMVSTGEQTGNLDKVLGDMGKFYEDEVNEMTENLTKLMEPLILLFVGGMVAFLAVAVYLPIYNIGNVIT